MSEEKLTEEQRNLFIAIWQDKIPAVVTWSDDEILMAMFHGA